MRQRFRQGQGLAYPLGPEKPRQAAIGIPLGRGRSHWPPLRAMPGGSAWPCNRRRRPVLVPVRVAAAFAVTSAFAVTRPVAVTRSRPAGLAAAFVAVVCQPVGGGRAMRLDRAVGHRGKAAAAGTRRHAGDWSRRPGRRPGRHCRCREVRRGRVGPLWCQVRLAGPSLLGRHRALPSRRRCNRRLPRSWDKGG